jgi:hypothetical protein
MERGWNGKQSADPALKGNCPTDSVCYSPATAISQHFRGLNMAAHGNDHSNTSGMDISQHKKTYHGFLVGSKWSLFLILGIMAFLAIFRTH